MKKIFITQKIEKVGKFNELRNTLDIRLTSMIYKFGFIPIPVPNEIIGLRKLLKSINPNGIILSGGGNPQIKDARFNVEKMLLNLSIKKNVPLLGICRGAQRINLHFKGKLKKVGNHVRKNHQIFGRMIEIKKKVYVNSYHNLAIDQKKLNKSLEILAYSSDGVIKSIAHKKHKIFGIMWHPERNRKIQKFDNKIFKKFFI